MARSARPGSGWLAAALARAFVRSFSAILAHFGLWRKPATVANLKFPLLAIEPGNCGISVLYLEPGQSQATSNAIPNPRAGTLLIDSDFKMCTERNVKCKQGDLGYLYRLLFNPRKPYTYKFDLQRCWRSGRTAALKRIAQCKSVGRDFEESEQTQKEIASQTTMAGIIAILQRDMPTSIAPKHSNTPERQE